MSYREFNHVVGKEEFSAAGVRRKRRRRWTAAASWSAARCCWSGRVSGASDWPKRPDIVWRMTRTLRCISIGACLYGKRSNCRDPIGGRVRYQTRFPALCFLPIKPPPRPPLLSSIISQYPTNIILQQQPPGLPFDTHVGLLIEQDPPSPNPIRHLVSIPPLQPTCVSSSSPSLHASRSSTANASSNNSPPAPNPNSQTACSQPQQHNGQPGKTSQAAGKSKSPSTAVNSCNASRTKNGA